MFTVVKKIKINQIRIQWGLPGITPLQKKQKNKIKKLIYLTLLRFIILLCQF